MPSALQPRGSHQPPASHAGGAYHGGSHRLSQSLVPAWAAAAASLRVPCAQIHAATDLRTGAGVVVKVLELPGSRFDPPCQVRALPADLWPGCSGSAPAVHCGRLRPRAPHAAVAQAAMLEEVGALEALADCPQVLPARQLCGVSLHPACAGATRTWRHHGMQGWWRCPSRPRGSCTV